MKNNYACITSRRHSGRLLFTAIIVFINFYYTAAQTCNQVEILYQSPACLEKHQGSVGTAGGSSCKEIAVCVNQPYTYSSSVTGAGWTFNWAVTGPAAVIINPNNTSAVVNIVWPQVGVFTLTFTATDGSGNVFTYCLKVNVKDKPNANFTFSPNNVCAGSTISFTNTTTYSGGGVAYSWNFGDPASGANNFSSTANPIHTYNAAGVYTVTLTAYSFTNAGSATPTDPPTIVTCCADTITMQVTILPGTLTIECISTVCAGDIATYTAVGCANPIWLPPVGGTFLNPPTGNTVTIIWGNGNPQGQILAQCPGGCMASVPVPIIPTNPIISGNAIPCFNSTTSYSLPVLPGTFYTWTLTNISTATNYNNLLNSYPDNNTVWIDWGMAPPGTYLLSINLNNKHLCCISNGSLIINPTQAWEAFSDQTVCTSPSVASLFVLPAAGTYNWTVLAPNAGATPLFGTGPTFNPTFSSTGIYTIRVTETGNNYCNSGIANPQQIQVTVVGTPAPGIINGPVTVCPGSDYSYSMSTNAPTGFHYEWSITGGTGSFQPGNLTTTTGNSATILWTSLTGTISVVLQRNGVPPCPTAPVTLNVVQATVGIISGPLNVCVDGTGSYTLSGGNLPAGEVITWSLAAPFSSMGTIISGQGSNSIIILWHGQPGVGPWGPVTINASTGCGNATPLPGIMIFPKFTFTITKTGIDICQPGGVALTVTGAPPASTYLWSTSATTSGITNITTAGTYDVTVTKGGCSFNKQYLVDDPFAIAPVTCGVGKCDANDSTNQMLGVTILKPLVGTFTYQWYRDTFPSGILIPGATTANYLTPTHGNFYVVVTYGSCSKHVSFKVSKVCCPDVNNPQITSVVRNTCNSYTFTGITANPFGALITWYYGDGTSDTGASGVPITHVYTTAGEYCVTFCVGPPPSNPTSCSGNCVATNVTVPIEAGFSYTLGCNGCLSVSNSSTVITNNPAFVTYFWDFGDGNTSVAQNPGIHCYSLPGTYVVSLTLTYNDSVVTCTKTATHTITYSILGINVSPTPVCTGTASIYSSTPGSFVSYTWNFGDGFTAYTPSSTHIYNTPATYLVTLTVVDQLGNTCNASIPITVLPGIGPCSIQPAFICPGGTAVLSTPNIAGYTYLWEEEISPNVFAPAPGVNTNNTYTVLAPGFFRVIITGVNGCSCITKKVEVKAVPKPKAIIAAAPSSKICGSGNVTLTSINHLAGHTSDWYANGNYGTLLSSGPVHLEFALTSTTIFNLVLTNEYGCTDTCSFAVIVNPIPVPPVITSTPTLCEGVPIALSVTNYASDITWNTGSATTGITVSAAGMYTATYTDPVTGCSSSSNITINRRPPVGLFPHYCDSIPCTCRNQLGDFTIYAPLPLIGVFAATYDIQWYFNNIPVGTNGPNPIFTPAVTGTYHIVVTDPITGCTDTSNTYSVVVPLCNQCDSTTCQVDLGNDTTICAGSTVTLTASGCTGTVTWYKLTMNGPVPIGNGPFIDVFPTQTTCYIVKCCDSIPDEINGGLFLCCCTDTICINVNPLPVVSWQVMFAPVCLNSAPVYLDTLLIFVSPTGGTGVFSGVNVIGNYFYPNNLGTFTITYCYTDINGCTTCVSNFISVVFCCDSTTCHVDLGNDTSICAGGVLILSAQGCNGNAIWYMMNPMGGPPVPIGQGPFIDVFPQVNTCYIVECCDTIPDPINGGFNICCCSDTICINVNPTPTVSWPVMFPSVCLNSAPVYLDTLSIFATPPGGTGVFSGVNVIGNYFYPNNLGTFTITYCYTDTNGCTTCVSNFINVVFCCDSTTCHVDLGNDTSICAGGVVILSAQGCNGNAIWYMMDPVGGPPVPIGQGPFIDVFPQVNTCYIVECCDTIPDPINGGFNICCCRDTICINVNPTPTVSWPVMFPAVCLNSAPVYLDTLSIFATPPGGTGVFSGVNVIGNYFYPNNLGTFTITYCYTDTNGCTTCVSNFISVVFCCDSTTCHVDLGNDTSICAGGVLILSAQGCNGNAIWYMMNPMGGPPVPIGQGPFIDVFPQVNTCYIVECCDTIPDPINGGFNICCCRDTICITVNPTPTVSWPVMFPAVCLNSAPVYLDTLSIFATPPGGTGVFSGVNVIGNYFYPNNLGTFTITYCYTDTNGCTNCVSNFINVIFCCDSTTCHVDLGNDTSICAGGVLILSAQGCNGNAIWYMMDPVGGPPVPIGQGPFIDVFPQVNTCYIVECCDTIPDLINGGFNICCCRDTICINVNRPPTVSWNAMYPSVCLNSAPVYLDTLNIFTFPPGGTGVFSGVNVIGNYFYPNNLGTFTITYCYTDTNGCTTCVNNTISVVFCCDSTSCHVDLGNDTSICSGGVLILTANGCNGNATWYQLTGEGAVPVGQGPILDVFPQVSTCYIVECCDTIFDPVNGFTVCCCSDTICITVKPTPTVSWPVMFPPVCLNSAPVYLDTLNIFATPPGGTGVFSGIGVIGNYFYPNTLGAYTITYCYVDLAGCTTCVSNTINVIFCCDSSSCHVDLGNDTSICSGGVIILTANGCNGNVTWYQLTGEGAVPVGQGPILDVFPQVSTCYIVECCDTIYDPVNGFTVCCCTDTICINVNPTPSVSWPVMFPPVCLNSAPVYLDTLNIFATPPGGTGVFSGIGVIGNYFYPNTLGAYTITYCYVDLAGCTTCVSNTINVIFCCDSTSCHVDLGNDTSICSGGVIILTANGCNGNATWYQLTPEGAVPIGQGPILDVFPQVSTCYIVECCDTIYDPVNGFTVCCCSDTICITVKPAPTVSWPMMFPPVCLNSAPVFLDPLNIFATPPGGTGVFSGIGVIGNYFYPNSLGTFTITYCYVSLAGCTTCVSKTITVINCCENSCQISAGPDQSICKGGVAILNVTGCDSIPKWYKLTMEGPVLIGQGPILDVLPQQTTCYMVICCCPQTNCCDTDTVCITVKPLPTISWPISFADVCINSAAVFLNPLSIIVNPTGGTGVFSGTGVFGNFFYPNTLGTHFITYTYTAPNGCTVSVSKMIKVKKCNVKLDIKIYLEGFYLGFGLMQPVLHNIGLNSDPTVCDSITVELHESVAPYSLVETASGILHTDGLAEIEFPDTVLTKSYYIVIRHRNSIETWSKTPVLINADPTGFDFTVH